MIPRGFAGRLALTYAALTTATVVLVLVGGRLLIGRAMVRSIDLLNQAEFQELAARLPPPATPALDDRALGMLHEHTAIDAPMFYFQVHAAGGAVLFRSANLGDTTLPAGPEVAPPRFVRWHEGGRLRLGEYRLGAVHVQVASSLEQFEKLEAEQDRTLLLLGGGVALASLAIGLGFSRLVLRPVRAIAGTAARIGAADLSARIPVPEGRDELAQLVQLLNRTFGRLEEAFAQVRRFSGEASHELKTPLALARLHAEKLARSELAAADRETLAALTAELQRLQKIIDDLLLLSRSDAGEMALDRHPRPIAPFLAEFTDDALALAEDRGLRLVVAAREDGCANFDPAWLRRVLLNLLSNALKFSPAGGTLTLGSTVRSGVWALSLADEGPGVPPAELERIFERFVQLGGARAAGDGAGLGLAIARSIVQRHDGCIRAVNRTDRSGLRIELELPAE